MATTISGFHKEQIGAKIILDTLDDELLLSSATTIEIWYENSVGSGKWTATLDGSNFTYTTTSVDDLPVAGVYSLQCYAEGPGWSIPGDIVKIKVADNLL